MMNRNHGVWAVPLVTVISAVQLQISGGLLGLQHNPKTLRYV